MLRPLDPSRRDGPLYPGASRTLRDVLPPHHQLVQIDAMIDFGVLAASLTQYYHQRVGRPAIHPEIVLRALVLAAIYQVTSYRQLCDRLSENLAWRWFCHLTLDDPVFDHSTLSVFLERVGSAGITAVLTELTAALAEADLLSGRLYLDSSLLPANVRTQNLAPKDPDDPPPPPIAGEDTCGSRVVRPADGEQPAQIRMLRYQDTKGKFPVPHHDPDARWGRKILGYKEHVLADRSGFILARRTTPAHVGDVAGARPLLDALPSQPVSLTADTGYAATPFRFLLQQRGITAYIPIAPTQDVTDPRFVDRYDHFQCPQGARLLPTSVPDADQQVRYAARAAACTPCPLRTTCVSDSRRSKLLWASRYRVMYPGAHRRNATIRAAREQQRRKTIIEGVFARLDRLGGTRARVRGLERVDRQNGLAALAHNILKALTKRRFWRRAAAVLPLPPLIPLRVHLTSTVCIGITCPAATC